MGRVSRRLSVRLGIVGAGALVFLGAREKWQLRRNAAMEISQPLPSRPRSYHMDALKSEVGGDEGKEGENAFDVLVVGGGIIGLYTAIDAAQRGLKTALVEAGDFGSGNSSCSEPLLPGAFPFVQRAIRQRDTLWLWKAREEMRASAIWSNVLPSGFHEQVRTLLPALHSSEWFEFVSAAAISTCMSPFCGPFSLNFPVSRKAVQTALPQLREARGGVVVEDRALDGLRVSIALARTAEALGVHLVSYAPLQWVGCVEGAKEGGKQTQPLLKARIRDDLATKNSYIDIHTRSIVNCTGSSVDRVRATILGNNLTEYPQAFERHYANSYLVVPKSAIQAINMENEEKSDSTSLSLPRRAQSMQVSSTLYSFNAAFLIPWADDCYLVGPSVSPFSFPANSATSASNSILHSSDGFKAQRERILSILESCGVSVDASKILSCFSHVVPVLKTPKEVGWAGEVLYQSFFVDCPSRKKDSRDTSAAVTESNSLSESDISVAHVYGGTKALAREVAKSAIDILLGETPAFQNQKAPACRTQNLKLCCPEILAKQDPDMDPRERLLALVRETYVHHLDDLIFRRTRIGYTSPAQALEALPGIADELARELQWSPKRKQMEIKYCQALLRETAVH